MGTSVSAPKDSLRPYSGDSLRQDPDTGDIECWIPDGKGRLRIANSVDVLASYIRFHEPVDESCEFDVPRH